MADLSDVETALVNLISAAVYPVGTGSPSILNTDCRVYRGWPNASALNADLAAGIVNVTIFPEAGGRNTTRYPLEWSSPAISTPTLTVSVAEPVVTFGGGGGSNQIAGIRTNAGAYAYALSDGDTPTTVAAALAALTPGAVASGATVTLSPSAGLQARVSGVATALMEVRRQVQSVRISCWCPDTATRDAAASAVDLALARSSWVPLSDGTSARLIYRWTFTNDAPTKDALWRRDFRYDVEYGTTIAQQFVQALFAGGVLTADGVEQVFGDMQPATLVQTDLSGNVLVDAVGNLIGVPAT